METPPINLKIVAHRENLGLQNMKMNIEGFLRAEKLKNYHFRHELILFMERSLDNDELLLDYLQARKYQVDAAWETLRRYAENRFIVYPNMFLNTLSHIITAIVSRHVAGVLKHRDKYGRVIVYLDTSKWDANEFTLDELTGALVMVSEKFWRHPIVLEKGIVIVHNTSGYGFAHLKQHGPQNLLRFRNLFVHSFPVAVKGIFYFHMPYTFSIILKMCMHLIPKKLRTRMHFYSGTEFPSALFDIAPPEVLLTWMGGKLTSEEGSEDLTFYE